MKLQAIRHYLWSLTSFRFQNLLHNHEEEEEIEKRGEEKLELNSAKGDPDGIS